MKQKKSLQKFTDSNQKFDYLLSLETITIDDIDILDDNERNEFQDVVSKKFNSLKGIERDDFFIQIEPILAKDGKNILWEHNHTNINWAISNLIQEFGRMPNKTEIAQKTGLSRQTIHKHLKEYADHPQFIEQKEQFNFMTSKVLASVFQFAINGDIAAAKLYFNVMGILNGKHNNTLIQNNNNFIQINGTVLSQEKIQNLSTEQLEAIETVLKSNLLVND